MTKRLLTLLIVAGAIALPAQTPTAPGQTPHAWPGLLSPKQPGYPSDLGSATALPINPLDYGAKCDGVTDDTQALQNALTAAAQTRFASLGIGSEIVQLPSGVCIISTTLIVQNQVILRGMGREVSEIKAGPNWTNPMPNALIQLGNGTAPVNGTRVEYLDINCNNIVGSIGLYSTDTWDQSGAFWVLIRAFGAAGVKFVGIAAHAVNGFILEHVESFNGIAGAGIGFDLDGGPGGWTFAPVLIDLQHSNATFPGSPCPAGMRLQRGNAAAAIVGFATEYCTAGILQGGPTGPASAAIFEVSCNHTTDCVKTQNDAVGMTAYGVTNPGGTNLINDQTDGITIPVRGNNFVSSYQGTYPSAVAALVHGRIALTYGAAVSWAIGSGDYFTLTATNKAAFTISNPTGYYPSSTANATQEIALDLYNNAGVALGTVTMGNQFKLAGGGSVLSPTPASGNHRLYKFYWDGASWRELSRSPADVPN